MSSSRKVGQRLLEFAAPLRHCARDLPAPPGRSARRSGTRPSRSPSRRGDPARRRECRRASRAGRATRQLRQPDARVDLVQRRIARCRSFAVLEFASGSPLDLLPATGSLALSSSIALGVRRREQVHGASDEPGPAGLVAGAEARAVVAVEVLVKQDQSRQCGSSWNFRSPP